MLVIRRLRADKKPAPRPFDSLLVFLKGQTEASCTYKNLMID